MVLIPRTDLENFCSAIFFALGFPQDESDDSARVLVAADARGIKSHGVARIKRYVDGIKAGLIRGNIQPEILRRTEVSLVMDAGGAMGLSVSKKAMEQVIGMARDRGIGVCSVRNSNHFGIAGYYAEMAAREDMIGIAMTNTAALGVPTFARQAMFGTNPIAFAAPALDGKMFSLDMATTTITRGKVEVYEREGKTLPPGWAVGVNGRYTGSPASLLDDLLHCRGGGLLPLGGEGETAGGYKGYGLAVLVDIMTALTSGGSFGAAVRDSQITSARVCHFFMALRIDMFRPAGEFKGDMSRMLDELTSLPPAEGADRVYYAGLKERENEIKSGETGVPLTGGVWGTLAAIAKELGIPVPGI
ncbi:MAG: Ldh family oxidoreductase [Spirochaetaceae bacterium]|jgi:LDH2 family malate/lactate/ureidoglycolate dehydrogenase|nr:Ldh family oxidoreductase [Spirochaetaceae bacterium]